MTCPSIPERIFITPSHYRMYPFHIKRPNAPPFLTSVSSSALVSNSCASTSPQGPDYFQGRHLSNPRCCSTSFDSYDRYRSPFDIDDREKRTHCQSSCGNSCTRTLQYDLRKASDGDDDCGVDPKVEDGIGTAVADSLVVQNARIQKCERCNAGISLAHRNGHAVAPSWTGNWSFDPFGAASQRGKS